jgi:hypothetical protein
MALLFLLVKRTSSSYNVVGRLGNKTLPFLQHKKNNRLLLLDFANHSLIHIFALQNPQICPFLHNPIVSGLTRLCLQTIAMHHCQEKVVHVLLLVVRFVILGINDYFALVAFQMARLTLYITWHIILSVGDCDIHMQILTCLD